MSLFRRRRPEPEWNAPQMHVEVLPVTGDRYVIAGPPPPPPHPEALLSAQLAASFDPIWPSLTDHDRAAIKAVHLLIEARAAQRAEARVEFQTRSRGEALSAETAFLLALSL